MIKEENEVLEAALLAPETVTGNFLNVNTSAISLLTSEWEGGNQEPGLWGSGVGTKVWD